METSTRPRSKSTFSFRSNKSSDNKGKDKDFKETKIKVDLHESHEEKQKAKFSTKTKANPNLSIVEAQPSAIAEERSTNISDLRRIQHKDRFGNVITDPDASNPSRSRFERPLDTIRSFEHAIDNGYKRRSEMIRMESADAINSSSRRSSYYANDLAYAPRGPQQGQSPYGASRLGSLKQGSYVDNYGPASSGYMQQQRRSMAPRPLNRYSSEYGVYPSQGYHEPYDTVNAGESSGSQSTEPWGNSTDPSSENSSIDRIHALNKLEGEPPNAHHNQPSPVHRTIMEEYDQPARQYSPQRSQYQQQGPAQHAPYQQYNGNGKQAQGSYQAPPSQPQPPQQREPIKLGGGSSTPQVTQWGPSSNSAAARPPIQRKPSEKKSWLKKRFSKKE